MKQILLLFSIYACLPCYAMEQQLVVSQEMRSPLNSAEQYPLCREQEQLLPRQRSLLKPQPFSSARLKKACKETALLWAIPIPISLASIPVGILFAHNPTLKYISYGMNAFSFLWASGWIAAHYRGLENQRLEYMRQYNAERDHILAANKALAQQSQIEPIDVPGEGSRLEANQPADQDEIECLLTDT